MTCSRPLAAGLAVLALLLGACGGADDLSGARSPSAAASAASPTSSAPASTAPATPAKKAKKAGGKRKAKHATPSGSSRGPVKALPPGAPEKAEWRDRAEADAVRAWAEAWARAVNEKDLTLAAGTLTAVGYHQFEGYARGDLGRYFPGPVPVSVRGIQRDGQRDDRAVVLACVWRRGWSQTSEKDPSVQEPLEVAAATVTVVEDNGHWLVDDLHGAEFGCSLAGMEPRRWADGSAMR